MFDCMKVTDHGILDGAPSRWRVPHSRYNDLPEDALASSGYRILSRLPDTGADMFVKQGRPYSFFFKVIWNMTRRIASRISQRCKKVSRWRKR